MFGKSKKITHVVTISPANGQRGGKVGAYGSKDVKQRKAEAKKLGVPVSVRRLKRDER